VTNKIKPISPKEAEGKKVFPDEVLEAFNALIVKNLRNGSASFKQDEVVSILTQQGFDENQIYKDHLLDVEAEYQSAGWTVEYDGPGYNETYPATFKFTKQ